MALPALPTITHPIGKYDKYRIEPKDYLGSNLDVSTATAISVTCKAALADADINAKFEKTLAAGVTVVLESAKYYIDFEVQEADTSGEAAGNLFYDVQVVDTATEVHCLGIGTFTLALPVKLGTPA
jgi:hypothetical protein